jgi:hypothetical protein
LRRIASTFPQTIYLPGSRVFGDIGCSKAADRAKVVAQSEARQTAASRSAKASGKLAEALDRESDEGGGDQAMKYVTRVLQPGETVEYATSLHWLVYVRAVLLLIVALIALIGSAMVGNFDWGLVTSDQLALALQIVALIFAIFAFFSWLQALIRRATTELAVTDRRVIYKTGLIRRYTIEINRSKVETVGVNQSLTGRILGYGTVIVRGTGGSFEPIPFIGDPLTFRSHITAG